MARTPRDYPKTMASPETGRLMVRDLKPVTLKVDGKSFEYRQPGWWCSPDDPGDLDGQLVDKDNRVAEMARRTAEARARGEPFPPALILAIRLRCGLSQRDAGEVFGTGEKSFEKYEAGQITPSKPTQRLLRLAMERPDLFAKSPRGRIGAPTEPDVRLIRDTMRAVRLDRIYGPLFEGHDADARRDAAEAPAERPEARSRTIGQGAAGGGRKAPSPGAGRVRRTDDRSPPDRELAAAAASADDAPDGERATGHGQGEGR
jgi:HTH-type transcriptional regulator/antitoxin MqsA